MLKRSLRTTLTILTTTLLLAACGSQPTPVGITPVAPEITIEPLDGAQPEDAGEATRTAVAIETETSPTATPEPEAITATVGLILDPPNGQASATDLLSRSGLETAANTYDTVSVMIDDSGDFSAALDTMLAEGVTLVILSGSTLADFATQAAAQHPDVQFAALDLPTDPALDNLLVFGGPESREDELGFVAGLLAGFASQNKVVGSIGPATPSPLALKYANGFIHGLRLSCGECEHWPAEVDDYNDPAQGQDAIRRLQNVNVDTVFAMPGPAGTAALAAGAEQSMWVVGANLDITLNPDLADLSPYLLPSPVTDVQTAIIAMIDQIMNGEDLPTGAVPFSYRSGTLGLALNDATGVTPGEIGYVEATIERLRSGELSTGIDPLTGEPF